jgi:hypothetical protein
MLIPQTLYRTLSEPQEGLDGRSRVEAITTGNLVKAASAVLSVLGLN